MSYDINRHEVDEECEGMYLIWDTARHYGYHPADEEVREHAGSCDECLNNGNSSL